MPSGKARSEFGVRVRIRFLRTRKRIRTLTPNSSVTEKLHRLSTRAPRPAQRNPPLLSQRDLVALQEHLGFAVDGHEGAVGALVGEHEVVAAPLDEAMLPRGMLVVDHKAAARI